MDFLTSELFGVEEILHLKGRLTNSDSNWLDGRLTAGEHAALVKQNRQLEPSSSLARSISEIVEQRTWITDAAGCLEEQCIDFINAIAVDDFA